MHCCNYDVYIPMALHKGLNDIIYCKCEVNDRKILDISSNSGNCSRQMKTKMIQIAYLVQLVCKLGLQNISSQK